MKFLLDENFERRFLFFLRQKGHDVTAIGEDYPHGLLDKEVLAIAVREQRILLTNDAGDFGKLIFHRHHLHYGVILFRHIRSGDIATKKSLFLQILQEYTGELHHFLVVTPRNIRVRKVKKKNTA